MAQTSTPDARLDRLRGPVAPRRHNARTIAALTGNPGCTRRAVLDGAGVDKMILKRVALVSARRLDGVAKPTGLPKAWLIETGPQRRN